MIRVAWIEYAIQIIQNHPQLLKMLEDSITKKLTDPEEKVRIATVTALGTLCTAHPQILPKKLMLDLAERCKDKKGPVRTEAALVISKVFDKVYTTSL